jgi:hypothetical protein
MDLGTDILWGAKEIARFLGCTEKTVWTMHRRGQLATFRQGRRVCARRSTLRAEIERQEASNLLSSREQKKAERATD